MRKEYKLPFGRRLLLTRSKEGRMFDFYYDEKYKELYIGLFKYLLIFFKDGVK